MTLYELFVKCMEIKYNHTENSGDYSLERIGNTLYIYLQSSDGSEDWKNNFDFPAKPYKRMNKTAWFAHRGFLKVFKSVEPFISKAVFDKSLDSIITVGYSHGAALAVLCHEFVWYNREDLREKIIGYGFGCPRVIWGLKNQSLLSRWERFTVIRNIDDIVTHIPPTVFGFYHVGATLEIGEQGKYSSIDAHRPESYLAELKAFSNKKRDIMSRF